MTSKYKRNYYILAFISFCLMVCPLVIYTVKAILSADLFTEKIALSALILVVGILSIYTVVTKVALRSKLWILCIGLYICLDSILGPIICFAVCQIIDELLITPLKTIYKSKYIIHREIDKRL